MGIAGCDTAIIVFGRLQRQIGKTVKTTLFLLTSYLMIVSQARTTDSHSDALGTAMFSCACSSFSCTIGRHHWQQSTCCGWNVLRFLAWLARLGQRNKQLVRPIGKQRSSMPNSVVEAPAGPKWMHIEALKRSTAELLRHWNSICCQRLQYILTSFANTEASAVFNRVSGENMNNQ